MIFRTIYIWQAPFPTISSETHFHIQSIHALVLQGAVQRLCVTLSNGHLNLHKKYLFTASINTTFLYRNMATSELAGSK